MLTSCDMPDYIFSFGTHLLITKKEIVTVRAHLHIKSFAQSHGTALTAFSAMQGSIMKFLLLNCNDIYYTAVISV